MSDERTVKKIFPWGNQTEEENQEDQNNVARVYCERYEMDGCQEMEEHSRRQNCIGCHSESGTG
jgi:hypothetical protein